MTKEQIQNIIEKAYPKPYNIIDGYCDYIFSVNGNQMIFNIESENDETISPNSVTKILDKLNGLDVQIPKDITFKIVDDETIQIFKNSIYTNIYLLVRGHGFLSGRLKLTEQEIVIVQNEFVKQCCQILNS